VPFKPVPEHAGSVEVTVTPLPALPRLMQL
jgi:hypothetical protein